MRVRSLACLLAFSVLSAPATVQAQGICATPGGGHAITLISGYFTQTPRYLFTTQFHLREGFGQAGLTLDGKWGPMTQSALCDALDTYQAINGETLGGWGLSDVEGFVNWVEAAAYANVAGGEFPD